MKEQDNYNKNITNQSNIASLSMENDNQENQISKNNIQLNNFNQNTNKNINNISSLNQIPGINSIQPQISSDTNLGLNSITQNISEFQPIEELNKKKEVLNNNYNNNQNNNLYNFNNNLYNNINNFYIGGNNNKNTKPFFTKKQILLNAYSLDEVNEYIQKDFLQLEKFLPNYKNYISNNNYESINICLKYIEYTNFFFNQIITKKVMDILHKIIYSNNNYINNYDNQSIDSSNIKKKIKELYNKLIPFEFRVNYLNIFYEKNNEKKLYNLFQNDLNKYQRQFEKKYYLYEIFEIVKQKMDNKDKEEIKNYFNRIYHNSNNNNLFLTGNNGMNIDKNGGNYSNHNNFHNNNSRQYRKYSYQSPNIQNRGNNSNNYYENNNYNNNGNNYHHSNYSYKNNYNNLNEDTDSLGYKNNYDNNPHHHNSAFQKTNNYKGSFSTRHFYNNNKNINLRNKGNRKNSAYSGVLVEVDSSPKKTENNENPEILNKEEEDEKEVEQQNFINNNEEEIKNGNENENNSDQINEDNNINNEEVKNNSNNINNEEIDLENNLNINNEHSKKENIFLKEEQINKNDDNSDSKDENLIQDFNSINPFHETVTSSEDNSVREESNSQLILNNPKSDNDIINLNMDNNLENKNLINNLENPEFQQEENSLILNIINNNQNNMINSAIYQNNNIENDPQNNLYDYSLDEIKEKENKNNNEIKEQEIVNNINTIDNKNIKENKSRDNSPKIISLSDSNILKVSPKSNNLKSNLLEKNDIKQNQNLNIQNNNNNLYINNNNINNITNDQLQLLKMMMLQNNNIVMNMNHFHNQINQKMNNNNINNIQINNNLNNINNNINNLNNLNLFNNLNTNLNLLNNNSYFSNNLQINNDIFSNYWNDKNNLLSNLKNIFNNNHSTNFNNHINYLNKQNEKLSIEYNQLKKENPEMIREFSNLFEEKIIFPVYAKINEEIQTKKEFYTEIYNKYRDIIIKILSKHNLQDTKVEPFGSLVNNFMTELGDIDICLVPKDNNLIQSFWEYLEEIKEEVKNNQKIAEVILIERYPRFLILKLKDKETNIDLDITVQNTLPIFNTKLIRLYSLLDQRFHILGIFLKFWVKKNKIHGALDKFLSSYALLILIIHYLQSIIDPKILPMLQEVQNIQKEYIYHYEEKELKTNLYFEEDLTQIENYMNIVNDRRENTSSVVELLIGFFDYYAYKYNHYLISISKSYKKPLPEEETIAFPLEDPFDVNYNPGKSMKINTLQFSVFNYCMKKELNNILSGEYFNIGSGE